MYLIDRDERSENVYHVGCGEAMLRMDAETMFRTVR
jgi:hypothetical protein